MTPGAGEGNETVLVAAADEGLRQSILAVLVGDGYRTLEAHDGHLAQRLVSNGRVDVALVELHLPGVDAATLIERIRTGSWGCPVVVISDDHVVGVGGATRDEQAEGER